MANLTQTRTNLAHARPIADIVPPVASANDKPLVLDLDQTLLRSDVLVESIVSLIMSRPWIVFRLILWALAGRAQFKRKVAEIAPVDYATLPINEEVAAFAAGRKAAGQRVVVATAADERAARRLMVRFPFVDEVIGSDGVRNLKGAAKARLLQMRYPQGFDYAGDSASDLHVWAASEGMILVEPSVRTARAARRLRSPDAHFARPSAWRTWAKALRLHQWAKNALVFAPLILSGLIGEASAWTAATLAFLALGFTASATYVLNDLADLPHDRKHRSKSRRPLASGRLPLHHGIALAVASMIAGAGLAAMAGPLVLAGVGVYVAVTLGYSASLKRIPFVDTATLAGLFTLRLVIGMAAVGATSSNWLLTFSMFLFLSLSLAKRHVEIAIARGRNPKILIAGRGYRPEDEPVVAAFGVSAAVASILVFVLYLSKEAAVATAFAMVDLLWLFPLLLFLWLSRIWLLCARGEMDDDPVAFSLRDKPSIAIGAATLLLFGAAFTAPFN